LDTLLCTLACPSFGPAVFWDKEVPVRGLNLGWRCSAVEWGACQSPPCFSIYGPHKELLRMEEFPGAEGKAGV